MIKKKDLPSNERRRYLRIDSVLPVAFHILSPDGLSSVSGNLQGFTCNIGIGGICLEINNLNAELSMLVKGKQAVISLDIEVPFSDNSVKAEARLSWVQELSQSQGKYLLGLSYSKISGKENSRLIHYVRVKKAFKPAAISLIILLALGVGLGSYFNFILIKGNKALVSQLVSIVQESSIAKQKVKQIYKEKEELQIKIQTLKMQIENVSEERAKLNAKAKLTETKITKREEELNALIERITQEKNALQDKMLSVQSTENVLTEELLRLDVRKATLEKANLEKMYQWLKVHQNPHTGLVLSFEGDGDLENWAFIYDQSLVLMAYTNFSDLSRAKKILDFFARKAKRIDGGFLNAYYVNDGQPAEFIVHSGPNLWLGIAILQYTQKTRDKTYLGVAEEIADFVIDLQGKDSDGGIRGGPQVGWYATEHNLDAYSFFKMLYQVTGKEKYMQAEDKVLKWLVAHTYDKGEVPIMRGKGDSTIATDTYAWSIAAIGPEKLESLGMNPDRIIEFAEDNCSVEVDYYRPEGRVVKVKGFDFAPLRHVARGGVVSSEWTAQMVLSFRIMADYCYQKGMVAKARSYERKADEYLSSLGNMVISSPSPSGQGESCLPYATLDFVDTGHGWMTPKGKTTGSVSGTAYTIFAYYKFNPLELKQ